MSDLEERNAAARDDQMLHFQAPDLPCQRPVCGTLSIYSTDLYQGVIISVFGNQPICGLSQEVSELEARDAAGLAV